MMLQDLGQYDEAARSCARTRILTRNNYWGALTTSWLEYGRGDLPEALRWSGEAATLEPGHSFITFYRIELMLMLRLVEQAREAARQIVTTDEAHLQLMRASLELAEHGPAGLRAYLDDSGTAALSSPNRARRCRTALPRRGRPEEGAGGSRCVARGTGLQGNRLV